MYLNFDDVIELDIEITNKCNAACPMCGRNNYGGTTRSDLKMTEWTLDFAKKVFSSDFKNLRNVMICGCYGDPTMAREAIEIVQHIKSNTQATVELYSNGSTRNADWWGSLGALLSQRYKSTDRHYRQHDLGIFSIDGLQDTNHIYRKNTDYNKIIKNAEAFIKAGGFARWDFIVFKHNEHQVEEAKKIANEMGFKQFRIRKTSRFIYSPDGLGRHRVNNQFDQVDYYIEPPTRPEFYNQEIDKYFSLQDSQLGLENYLKSTPINCLYKNYFKRYYIDCFGLVYPCCYLGADNQGSAGGLKKQYSDFVKNYELNFNSLHVRSWEEIINHQFFVKDLLNSFTPDSINRLKRCGRTCGEKFSPILSQSKDTLLG